jgi:acyl-[acyl carrier protein]--UDP-N-acetylglucosamine O-acyltransferase
VGEEVFVVAGLTVHAMAEDGDHILIGFLVEVVDLIPFVQDIGQQVRRRGVDDGGRDDVGNVAEVFVLGQAELGVRVELPDCCEVDIAAGKS